MSRTNEHVKIGLILVYAVRIILIYYNIKQGGSIVIPFSHDIESAMRVGRTN